MDFGTSLSVLTLLVVCLIMGISYFPRVSLALLVSLIVALLTTL